MKGVKETPEQKQRRKERLELNMQDPMYRARYLARRRTYYKTLNKEKQREYNERYRTKHSEAYKERQRQHAARSRKERPEQQKQIQKRHVAKLPDSYVVQMLVQNTGIPRDAIPPALIELKRLQIQLYRAIHEKL